MKILQLGAQNWADKYKIPREVTWLYNTYSSTVKRYDVVIITEGAQVADNIWKKLQWQVDPYCVLYSPLVEQTLSEVGRSFISLQYARQIVEDHQELIDRLPTRFFNGQSGMRIPPTKLLLNNPVGTYTGDGHLTLEINADHWTNIGSYQHNIYLDPYRHMKFSLEYQRRSNLKVRLRIFEHLSGGDNLNKPYLLDFSTGVEEKELPIKAMAVPRFASVSVEVLGKGKLTLGSLHSRWSRIGYGAYFVGGKRLVDSLTGEDLAYYFNPGDLRPPLHVYFAGARGLEGFEAYPLFRKQHAPTLLFTDPRLAVGQFYTREVFEDQIKKVILDKLQDLGFNQRQLVLNGISMGTYPAIKLGAQLTPFAINVAKPIANLGWVARRARLSRPDEFATIFDIDRQLIPSLTEERLDQLDREFWQLMKKNDLTKTRLYIGYMENDDYDDLAVKKMRENPAMQKARLFISQGFPGRHNDNPAVVQWFVNRLADINKAFGRGE